MTGNAYIDDVQFPSIIYSGVPFDITINIKNKGEEDLLWIKIIEHGSCSLKTTQATCEHTSGCYWYTSGCYSTTPNITYLEDVFNAGQIKTYVLSFASGLDYTRNFGILAGCYPYYTQTEICTWIADQGGPTGIVITKLFEILDAYLYNVPPEGYSFIPTIINIMGIIDYYLGFINSGNSKTKCNF